MHWLHKIRQYFQLQKYLQMPAYQIMLMTLRSEMNIIQTRYPARVTWKSCTDIGADLASNQDTNYSIYLYSEKGWKVIYKKMWNKDFIPCQTLNGDFSRKYFQNCLTQPTPINELDNLVRKIWQLPTSCFSGAALLWNTNIVKRNKVWSRKSNAYCIIWTKNN